MSNGDLGGLQAVVDGDKHNAWRAVATALVNEPGRVVQIFGAFDIPATMDPHDDRNRIAQGTRGLSIVDGLWYRDVEHQAVL